MPADTHAVRPGAPGHGRCLRGVLRLLVRAGFTPAKAERAATALSARCPTGRGRGLRAAPVLVGGPTTTICDTPSIPAI